MSTVVKTNAPWHKEALTVQKRFVGIRALAQRLGMTMKWCRAKADAGLIPCVRDGNRLRFPLPEAEQAAVNLAVDSDSKHASEEPAAS